jgi:hypothetical protein
LRRDELILLGAKNLMKKFSFYLSTLLLATLLASCASKTAVRPVPVKAMEETTSMPLLESSVPVSTQAEVVHHDPPASCPITTPQNPPFTAPKPYSPNSPFDSNFWYGSSSLWTDLPRDGIWYALPHNREGYTQKIFWWREGYIWNEEPQPELTVSGERLDAAAPPVIVSRATNAYAGDIGSAMLVGVDFPTLGCWKITGKYADVELSFVVWVAP